MSDTLRQRALEYHQLPKPGKIGIEITKPSATQADLVLAYTPGVAAPVREIANDPNAAYRYTAKGNLVAVIDAKTHLAPVGEFDRIRQQVNQNLPKPLFIREYIFGNIRR